MTESEVILSVFLLFYIPPLFLTTFKGQGHSTVLFNLVLFLLPTVKKKLAQETFKKSWVGVVRIIAEKDCVTAFRRYNLRCQKGIHIASSCVKKS